VLAHQRDELLGGNEKRNRINETEQSQNNETRQPIGISACEKFLKCIAPVHLKTSNANKSAIGNPQSAIENCQGEN
jgi:hypothetical protein